MSTLTLAVEGHFKSGAASSPPQEPPSAAGSVLAPIGSGAASRSALVSRADKKLHSLGAFSKSTPELTDSAMAHGAPHDACAAHDDSAPGISWARTAESAEQAVASEPAAHSRFAPPTFVNLPRSVKAFPESSASEKPSDAATETPSKLNASASASAGSSSSSSSSSAAAPAAVTPAAPDTPRVVLEVPPAPLLRNLKSSLKLPGLTKSLSTSQLSPPKSVRFASRLEKVKMFDGMASPSAVSLQNTPIGSPSYSDFHTDYFSFHHDINEWNYSDDDDYSSSDSDTYSEFTKDRQYRIASSNFSTPRNIYDKRACPVYLQSCVLSADKKSLVVLVMCQNLAFEKQLSLKFTFNNWHSSMTYNSATYTASFASVNFDQFKFNIPLSHLPSSLDVQFCIKYVVSGATYWDNNNCQNYRFSLSSYTKPPSTKDTVVLKPSAARDSFSYKPPTFSPSATPKKPSQIESKNIFNEFSVISNTPRYNELVSKLMSVKVSEEGPKFQRSLVSSPKPRYSQSYKSKKLDDLSSPLKKNTTDKKPVQAHPISSASKGTSASKRIPVDKEAFGEESTPNLLEDALTGQSTKKTEPPATAPRPHLITSSSAPNIKSMSYADLLQNYCFTGTDQSAKTPRSPGALYGSCNSSSSSLSSGYTTPTNYQQPWTDTFFI